MASLQRGAEIPLGPGMGRPAEGKALPYPGSRGEGLGDSGASLRGAVPLSQSGDPWLSQLVSSSFPYPENGAQAGVAISLLLSHHLGCGLCSAPLWPAVP